MRIYSLTGVGQSIASTPTNNDTPGWRIVYFLRRHGNRASDDQIKQFTGLDSATFNHAMAKLTNGENPVVTVIS